MRDPLATRPLVVVVDDDASVCRSLGRLLRSTGFDVEAFASAGELLAHTWPVRPACMVLDVHLPDMSGFELLQWITEDSHIPVVMITGHPAPELRTRALQQGATAFLTKPVDEEELLQAIHRALGR